MIFLLFDVFLSVYCKPAACRFPLAGDDTGQLVAGAQQQRGKVRRADNGGRHARQAVNHGALQFRTQVYLARRADLRHSKVMRELDVDVGARLTAVKLQLQPCRAMGNGNDRSLGLPRTPP